MVEPKSGIIAQTLLHYKLFHNLCNIGCNLILLFIMKFIEFGFAGFE